MPIAETVPHIAEPVSRHYRRRLIVVNAARVVRKLFDVGLINSRDVVDGGLEVSDVSQRNRNFVVQCSTRTGYFVKCPAQGETSDSVANEATFYDMVRQEGFEVLEASLPRFVFHDATAEMLVLELCSPVIDGADLAEASLRPGSRVAGSIGRVLAACHAIGYDQTSRTQHRIFQMPPWAFNIARPTTEIFRTITPLQLQVLRLIGRSEGLERQFDRMQRGWNSSCLIHGDIRWDNLLAATDASGEFNQLKLIDWEGAGYGDPAWDVASVFSAYMGHCLLTLPLDVAESPQAAALMFADRLPDFRRPMQDMWTAYVGARTLNEALASELLRRALLYMGLRLLQFAFEWGEVRADLPRFVLCSVQLAVNVLNDSDEGRAHFLAGS